MHELKITPRITVRDSRSIVQYYSEVNKEPLLTTDQEVELAQRIHKGDKEALERMVRSNLRFVISVANQYVGCGLDLMDIVSEGNIGLMKAAERFDETRGFKFISYAVWWIRQCIMEAIAEKGRLIRVPLNKLGEQHKIFQFIAEFEQHQECRPNVDEIAEGTGIDVRNIKNILGISGKHSSLDSPLKEGEEGSLIDVLVSDTDPTDKNVSEQESLEHEMGQVLNQLSQRDGKILCHSFGLFGTRTLTLEEIGQKFGLSKERVRQIRTQAILRIRMIPECSRLRVFL